MRKKLQVFISSTYKDLVEERQAAVQAVLRAGHIPAGMELFNAGNESQLETIKRWIDDSDIYLLILGGRYGSIEPKSGKSYTHLEYEYAAKKGVPLFAIVISNDAMKSKYKIADIDMDNRQKYHDFRKEVLEKTSLFFEDQKDIENSILRTIGEFEKKYSFFGWISGKDVEEDENLLEENQRLKAIISSYSVNNDLNRSSIINDNFAEQIKCISVIMEDVRKVFMLLLSSPISGNYNQVRELTYTIIKHSYFTKIESIEESLSRFIVEKRYNTKIYIGQVNNLSTPLREIFESRSLYNLYNKLVKRKDGESYTQPSEEGQQLLEMQNQLITLLIRFNTYLEICNKQQENEIAAIKILSNAKIYNY